MTWAFVYLVALLVGLVLATVTGLLRDLRNLSRHHHLVVPHPDQQSAFLALLGRRLAVGSFLFGLVGLAIGARGVSRPGLTFPVALGAGLVGFVLGVGLYRRPRVEDDARRVGHGGARHPARRLRAGPTPARGGSVVLAAQNIDQASDPGRIAKSRSWTPHVRWSPSASRPEE